MARYRIASMIAAGVVGMSALSGCTYSLEKLRVVEPVESPFHRMLAAKYRAFAENEAEQYDWLDSQYFAKKGLEVAYGKGVLPELPSNWHIPVARMEEALFLRDRLITRLSKELIEVQPEAAATAIFSYDCWLEQLEENWQEQDIDACHAELKVALQAIEGGYGASAVQQVDNRKSKASPSASGRSLVGEKAEEPTMLSGKNRPDVRPRRAGSKHVTPPPMVHRKKAIAKPTPVVPPAPEAPRKLTGQKVVPGVPEQKLEMKPVPKSLPTPAKLMAVPEAAEPVVQHVVLFELDSASMTSVGRKAVSDVLMSFPSAPYYVILLGNPNSHTSPAPYMRRLLSKRAEAIRGALIGHGVEESRIRIQPVTDKVSSHEGVAIYMDSE